MAIQLMPQLPLDLSILLLLLLHFSCPLSEALPAKDDRISYPADAEAATMELWNLNEEAPKNKTKLEPKSEIVMKEESTDQPKSETTQQPTEEQPTEQPKSEPKPTATDQPKIELKEYQKVPKIEIGPRITLDTLPFCPEGTELHAKRCRKKA